MGVPRFSGDPKNDPSVNKQFGRVQSSLKDESDRAIAAEAELTGRLDAVAPAGGGLQLPSFTVSGVPAASVAGQMIYVSDETGGAVPAFSDGTNWRRVTDRAVIS